MLQQDRDLFLALAQRRQAEGEGVQPVVQIFAQPLARQRLGMLMFVAARMRTSTLITVRLPRRENCWSCRTCSSLACRMGGISPISSSRIVPLLHSSN